MKILKKNKNISDMVKLNRRISYKFGVLTTEGVTQA